MQQRQIFISYARQDGRTHADDLYNLLGDHGINAWRDERNIDPYQDFSGEIENAIENANHVLVCLTPSIAKRKDSFVRREIVYAQNQEKPITPIIFPEFDKRFIPILIAHLTWLDFSDFQLGFKNLLTRLKETIGFIASPHFKDPHKDYLETLHRQIVYFLNSTVFSLLDLHSIASSDAVLPDFKRTRTRALPMAFEETALNLSNSDDRISFSNFPSAFEHYKQSLLLLGNPGTGKTTTLMAYAREAVTKRIEDPSQPLPLIGRISTWDPQKSTPFDIWLANEIPMLTLAEISSQIANNKTLLILDGLDELGDERIRPKINPRTGEIEYRKKEDGTKEIVLEKYDPRSHFINTYHEIKTNNNIIISCRVKDYNEIGNKISLNGAVTLQPLDDTQLQEYLHDYPILLDSIQKDMALKEMARTPLLLGLLTYAYSGIDSQSEEVFELGSGQGELRDKIFETYIKKRYEHEYYRPNVKLKYDLGKMLGLLEEVAYQDAMSNVDNVIQRSYIVSAIGGDIEHFLEQTKRLHLLLINNEGQIRFIHLWPYPSLAESKNVR